MKRSFVVIASLVILFPALLVNGAWAKESYPTRPITLILPSGAGMSDSIMRVVCRVAEKDLGQPIVIENKPAGGGIVAVSTVLKSKPDGYTLGMAVTGFFICQPQTQDLPYNVLTDTTDIITIAKYNYALCVKADAPWSTLEDVIAYARKNPGQFTYASYGTALMQQVTMERIAMKEGIKWTAIPFKSGGESVVACLGGHASSVLQGSVDVVPYVNTGKLKILVFLDDYRWPEYPTVPHIREKYNFHSFSFISLFAPKGLPESIRQRLENVFKKAMEDPSFSQIVKQFGILPAYMSGKDYSALWRSHYEEAGKVLKALGLVEKK